MLNTAFDRSPLLVKATSRQGIAVFPRHVAHARCDWQPIRMKLQIASRSLERACAEHPQQHPCTLALTSTTPGSIWRLPAPIQMSRNLSGRAKSWRNGASPRNMDENTRTFHQKSKDLLGSLTPCKNGQNVATCNGLSCDLERNLVAVLQKGHKK